MSHLASSEDKRFQTQFETFAFAPDEFNHRAHVRLAYVYLCDNDPAAAHLRIRDSLCGYLSHHGVAPSSKYHETVTQAWILAVRHFMIQTPATTSAATFIEANPQILDPEIMMSHYSKDVLFSAEARGTFVEPDIEPIPRYGDETA